MGVEIAIAAGKVVFLLLLLVLQVVGMGVFFERKVSAVIQNRIGANRASIFGFAGMGIINTLVADPVKFDLQDMVRLQRAPDVNWWPHWGVFYQPLGMIILLVAGVAESKRIPFDLPESESELVSGYFTEYSGAKHLMFMMADFVEVVLVAALVTTFFLGGWQVPWVDKTSIGGPWGPWLVVLL